MAANTSFHLSVGDRAPGVIGITATGTLYATDEQAGRAVVMILAASTDVPELPALLAAFSERADALGALDTDLVALIAEDVEAVFIFNFNNHSRATLVGSPNEFLERIGFASAAPEVLVLDGNARVAAAIGAGDPAAMVAAAMDAVTRLPHEAPRDICSSAPVLILPNLIEPALCEELVALHHAGATFMSPALYLNSKGMPQHDQDYNLKKRRDCLLAREHPMHDRLTAIMAARVFPEIKRCFQANVSRTERFNLACYPGDGGHFRRHRDDRPQIVAHRRFALSINLTLGAEGYEGGFLRLPEFNRHHYRCPPGGGVIFSVALLHEITPVTSGNRYVMVTHLYDEEGEAQRQAMDQTMAEPLN